MKKILLLTIISILIITLVPLTSVAGGRAERDPAAMEFTFVTPLLSHPVWLRAKQGFEDAGRDLGVRTTWVGPQGLDVSEMISQIETAIAQKVDGIVTFGLNPEAMIPVLNRVEEAGIPLVLVLADVPDAPYLAFLGLDPEGFGIAGAEALLDALGPNPDIVGAGMIPSIELITLSRMLDATIDTLQANAGSFRHTTIAESRSEMLTAVSRWEEILTTYPEVNVLYATGAETGPAAAQVLRERNLVGDILVLANDDIDETLDAIRDGAVYATTATNFYRYAYQAAEILHDFVTAGATPTQRQMLFDPVVVTQDNVDTYGAEMMDRSLW